MNQNMVSSGVRRSYSDQDESVTAPESVISFESFENCIGFDKAEGWILSLIEKHGCRSILEVGSGANPTLSADIVSRLGLHYVANDVDAAELEKADAVFDQWVGDVARDPIPARMENSFDLVFSRMVNEHIQDGRAYHLNIRRLLCKGGISAHCFSTLYCLPFVANRILPEWLSDVLVRLTMPGRNRHQHRKFRAYYSWSRGPSRRMIANFESLGFQVLKYIGYFGHDYYRRLPFLHALEMKKSNFLVGHPVAPLTSLAMLIVRKG